MTTEKPKKFVIKIVINPATRDKTSGSFAKVWLSLDMTTPVFASRTADSLFFVLNIVARNIKRKNAMNER